MRQFLQMLGRETDGATAVEYGLILALVFLAMIGAIRSFGISAISMWTKIADSVTGVGGG